MKSIIKKALKRGFITVRELNALHDQCDDDSLRILTTDEVEFLSRIEEKITDPDHRIELTPTNKRELLEYLINGTDAPMVDDIIKSANISRLSKEERNRLLKIAAKLEKESVQEGRILSDWC